MKKKIDMKNVRKKLKALSYNPQAEIYSQNRRVWENSLIETNQTIQQLEDALIYRRGVLILAEKKLKEINELESEKNNTSKE